MKKRTLFIGLVLALVLTALMPTAALAAKPVDFSASGSINGITPGAVKAAGASGRYIVEARQITGALTGDISGSFTLDYKANVTLATQAGNLHGTLDAGIYSLEVNGKIQPLEFVWFAPFQTYLPMLEISGQWTFVNGAKGNGDFTAYAVFIPTPDGHVGWIVDSGIALTGKWQP